MCPEIFSTAHRPVTICVTSVYANPHYEPGSTWTNSDEFRVGEKGDATLTITGGGTVTNGFRSIIGTHSGSKGEFEVDGSASTWANRGSLLIGYAGAGTLSITSGGMVHIDGILTITGDAYNTSFINMSTGGMLALFGNADANGDDDIVLTEFLDMIDGSDAIRYWDGSDWADITGATMDTDYTLAFVTDGGVLDGYTMLTVGVVPEPSTLVGLMGLCLMG